MWAGTPTWIFEVLPSGDVIPVALDHCMGASIFVLLGTIVDIVMNLGFNSISDFYSKWCLH